MRLRLMSVLAGVVATGLLGGMLGFAPQAARAATPPPYEPDPNARGCLNFYNASGALVTSGSVNDSPIAAFAQAAGPTRAGDNTGTLFGDLVQPGTPSVNWPGEQMSAGNAYPDPTEPANLASNPTNPTYVGAAGDETLGSLQSHFPHPGTDPAAYQGVYQVRLETSGFASGSDPLWWRADIQITGSTWTQTWCPPPAQAQTTTTSLSVAPPSTQTQGMPVNLTANVTPVTATGSVQFKDAAANLGPAVSVTAGTAGMSTSSLSVGSHSLSAVFIPTDPTAFSGSTSNVASYTITSAAKSADVSVAKTGPATATASSPITYTLSAKNSGPDPASGVAVTDTLPAGVGFVSANSTQGTCSNGAGTVTCSIGSLANGASATITINATAPATTGTITNSATIGANEPDPNPANNSASATTVVSAPPKSADVAITKAGPATATAGSPITYTLTGTNNGPDPATGVMVTDTLPAGVVFVSASSTQGSCTNTAGTVTCAVGSLASGASASMTINATAPATAGTITNSATIGANEPDPNPANNTASATTVVSVPPKSADVAITKAGPATATAGSPITYSIGAMNNGPDPATGVVVTDTLPVGTTFVSASSTLGSCTDTAGTVTCAVGSLASGASATITIVVSAPPTAGTITNSATIGANEPDPNPANNTASATTVVSVPPKSADVAITKAGPADATAGSPIAYTLTGTNNGPDPATSVAITDALPAGVVFVSASPGCTNSAGTVTCTIGPLAVGASATFTINATAPSTAVTITNTATIKANEADPNPANNSASATTVVSVPPKSADVAITKAGPATATAGSPITYTLTGTNNGPDPATGVVITDALPAGVTFVSASPGCTNTAGTVTCTIGPLAVGASATFMIDATAPSTAVTITNTATIQANEADPNPANNSASATTVVSVPPKSADVAITKAGPATATAGSPITYTLTGTNNGPDPATVVVVTDTLPVGTTFVSASSTQGSCTDTAGTVTCAVGSLASGASASITINATAPATAGSISITNTATIGANEPDPNPANNTASATTVVSVPPKSADVAITKAGPATATAGSPITYSIGAMNNGPDPATGVMVTDTPPAGTTFVSASSTQGTCTNSAGTVTCAVGSLASGASASMTINLTAPAAAGTITNTATIGANEPDPNPANNTASATTVVSVPPKSADVAITKAGPATATAGSPITYTLTGTNNGPDPATGVVITDALPAGVTFVSASPGCTNTAGTVTCTIGPLAVGASATFMIDATAPSTAVTITNTATIKANEADPNPANNTASATTQVSGVASGTTDLSIRKFAFSPEWGSFRVNRPFWYVLVVRNSGPSTATGVTVKDVVPSGMTINYVFTTAGSCTKAGQAVTCGLGTMNKGRFAFVVINVTPTQTGTFTNMATVGGDQTDPNPVNNAASVTISVMNRGDSEDNSLSRLLGVL